MEKILIKDVHIVNEGTIVHGDILIHQGVIQEIGESISAKSSDVHVFDAEGKYLLPGVIDKFAEWNGLGYTIVLTTGRRESERGLTIKQLQKVGLQYDHLIMGLGRGSRVLINDIKPNSDICFRR